VRISSVRDDRGSGGRVSSFDVRLVFAVFVVFVVFVEPRFRVAMR
jgi:hypothetical protein